MKRSIIFFSLGLLVWVALPSCKKDPETEPREIITGELIFDKKDVNAILAKQFLNNVYNFLPNGFNRIGGDFLDAATNDAVPTRIGTSVENYTNGRISVVQNPDNYWGNSYAGIRQANIFLANIDSVPVIAATKNAWKAEARFIRAFMYYELLKRYGGVPLIGDKIFTLSDNLELPRNTFEEIVNYIVSECDAIKTMLVVETAIADGDLGRIPRGAAIALKCRVYLYAASPFFNGGATAGPLKTRGVTGYPTADPARWQKVIESAEELTALNFYALQSSFLNAFIVRKNTEVILAKQSGTNFDIEINNAPISFINNGTPSGGRTSPTQNLVDAFPMTNGLAITDPASGYNAANPYTGRDPRFGATIFYNNGGINTAGNWFNRAVETFEGGGDKPNNSSIQTKTGYYLRKFMINYATGSSYAPRDHNFIYFRYAEILLNYAEALNEVNRVEDAVTQVKLIRARAGITAGGNTRYGIKAGITQAEMRDLVRNERRIELAFEEQRFWDVRRWKIASQELNGPVFGIKIIRSVSGTYTYERVQAGTLVFSDKLYLMPLPYDEITKNSKLEQNPGW
ncbi:MAG: RagB/SusD family nutrient uptake outer membrane protein [Ferruginibacter sp.]|nr:RagB/SusD family nutrient uptake outer membrane protein [Ferruginibacter sp.]